ncbi:MAG: hypothetical protein AEth_01635 [Candidatus Argoarchaeum ethanivorans]|uniref:Uncharacterized protein n=1 Tax=Candidatus Argoarchaeum ethanivorans TaxID=2608793 RepID=A0A8B3S216_9EURY|nr:MAG: hypothetical protein AEth_01635 [Candidatus Argoarchaeum ethanivorans]
MANSYMPVEFRILVEGFITGLMAGIGFKTGISPDEGSILILIMKEICKAIEGMTAQFNCWGFITPISSFVMLSSLFAFLLTITKMDDWRIGLVIYGVGFSVGLLLIIF